MRLIDLCIEEMRLKEQKIDKQEAEERAGHAQ